MLKNDYVRLLLVVVALCLTQACSQPEAFDPGSTAARKETNEDSTDALRERLVRQLESEGIYDKKVLAALRKVPRHEFVPERYRSEAYGNYPVPIGMGQTISQPYIVAYMTQALKLRDGEKVLEIGTGSGYQAAILAEIAEKVYTIEILEPLARNAEKTLARLGYKNVFVKVGDGYKGWPENAPFDAIIVTAAPDHVPQPLVEQLKVGGRMVIPVGKYGQRLILITKDQQGIKQEEDLPVLFVPMTGEAQRK